MGIDFDALKATMTAAAPALSFVVLLFYVGKNLKRSFKLKQEFAEGFRQGWSHGFENEEHDERALASQEEIPPENNVSELVQFVDEKGEAA